MTALCIPAESDPRPYLIDAEGYEGVRIDAQIWAKPSDYDARMGAIRKAGLSVVHVLAYFAWDAPFVPGDYPGFAKRCAGWAERHYREGDILEVYNEPDHPKYWRNPDPAEYSKLLGLTASAIRSKLPTAKIVTGGLANVAGCGEYLRGMVKGGCWEPGMADGCGLHPYPEGGSVEAGLLRGMLTARPLLPPGIEIHATELGHKDDGASFDAPTDEPSILPASGLKSHQAKVSKGSLRSPAASLLTPDGEYPAEYVKGDPGAGWYRVSCWASAESDCLVRLGLDDDHAATFAVGPVPRRLSAVFQADPKRPVSDRRLYVAKPLTGVPVTFDARSVQPVSLTPEDVSRLRLGSKLQQVRDAPRIAERLGYASCALFANRDHNGSYGIMDERGRSKALML